MLKSNLNVLNLLTRRLSISSQLAEGQSGGQRKGFKKYPFNPNFYPKAPGKSRLGWKVPKENRHLRVSLGNNGHNVPLFKGWSHMTRSSVRVNDPIHGEKFMYPHAITNQVALSQIPYRRRRSGKPFQKQVGNKIIANPNIRAYFETTAEIEHLEKTKNLAPVPREINHGPFECPNLAMIEKFIGMHLLYRRQGKGVRDNLQPVANEIRYRQIMKVDKKKLELEKLEAKQLEILHSMLEKQGLNKNQNFEEIDKLKVDPEEEDAFQNISYEIESIRNEIECIEIDPYQLITKAIDMLKPTVDFQIVARGPTHRDAIPIPITEDKALKLAIRWIGEATTVADPSRRYCTQGKFAGRDLQLAHHRIVDELYNSLESKGYAFNKKLAHHKIAEAQRQYTGAYWATLKMQNL